MRRAREWRTVGLAVAVVLGTGCTEPANAPTGVEPELRLGKAPVSSDPVVSSTLPSDASRGTTLDVEIYGSGFSVGSQARFELDGTADARVRVNSTRFVSSGLLSANLTIDADAVIDLYDVVVITPAGKKGIGTEKFEVTLQGEILEAGRTAESVNASGVVAGVVSGTQDCPVNDLPQVWDAVGLRTPLPLGSFCHGNAIAINASGVVLGQLLHNPIVGDESALWSPSPSGYLLEPINPTAAGHHPMVRALNDARHVIGSYKGSPYWWSAATGWIALARPTGATLCQIFALNNIGQIAGYCTIGRTMEGVYWAHYAASPILLPRPAAKGDVYPRGMNDAGIIVGIFGGTRAVRFIPTPAGYRAELLPDKGFGAKAEAIASDGSIVGVMSTHASGRQMPSIWSPGGAHQLLGMTEPAATGTVYGVELTPEGIVVVGQEYNPISGSRRSIRWKATSGEI